MASQKLIQALSKGVVVVTNKTAGQIHLSIPVLVRGYPTGERKIILIQRGQTVDLTKEHSIKALRMSRNLGKLVKAGHLGVS